MPLYDENLRKTVEDNTTITFLARRMYAAISYINNPVSNTKIECQSIGITEKVARSKVFFSILGEIKKHNLARRSEMMRTGDKKKRYGRKT